MNHINTITFVPIIIVLGLSWRCCLCCSYKDRIQQFASNTVRHYPSLSSSIQEIGIHQSFPLHQQKQLNDRQIRRRQQQHYRRYIPKSIEIRKYSIFMKKVTVISTIRKPNPFVLTRSSRYYDNHHSIGFPSSIISSSTAIIRTASTSTSTSATNRFCCFLVDNSNSVTKYSTKRFNNNCIFRTTHPKKNVVDTTGTNKVVLPFWLLTKQKQSTGTTRRLFSSSPSTIIDSTKMTETASTLVTVQEDADAYNQYASVSVELSDPTITSDGMYMNVIRSVRDIDSNKRRKYLYTIPIHSTYYDHYYKNNNNSIVPLLPPLQPPIEINDSVLYRLPSPSGKKMVILRNEDNASSAVTGSSSKKGSDTTTTTSNQILEVWVGPSLIRKIRLQPQESKHGRVIVDPGGFGVPSWNADETMIVYSAERILPETKSFFNIDNCNNNDSTSMTTTSNADVDIGIGIGDQHTLGIGKAATWGEKYQHSMQTTITDLYIVNIETGLIGRVPNVPGNNNNNNDNNNSGDGYTLGQAIFSPTTTSSSSSSQSIVYTGWDAGGGGEMPRRLGMIYCQQRSSKLYTSSITTLTKRLNRPATLCTNTPYDQTETSTTTKSNKKQEQDNEDMEYVILTPDHRLAVSPRFSASNIGTNHKLLYLSTGTKNPNDGFDTHSGCYALHSIDWDNVDKSYRPESVSVSVDDVVIVDQVWNPRLSSSCGTQELGGLKFPGLFLHSIPSSSFVPNTDYILLTTMWGSFQKIVRISILNKTVSLMNFTQGVLDTGGTGVTEMTSDSTTTTDTSGTGNRTDVGSEELICITRTGDAIISCKSMNRPPVLYHVKYENLISDDITTAPIEMKVLCTMEPIASTCYTSSALVPSTMMLSSSTSSVSSSSLLPFSVQLVTVDSPVVSGVEYNEPIQCLLLLPKKTSSSSNTNDITNAKKPRLIVVVHGGPHSVSSCTYLHSYAYLCGNGGYAILFVNYRGSVGFGQGSIESLPGNIGTLDVQDVVACTQYVQKKCTDLIDSTRIGICGGSHGGFLTAHLTSQYPDLFRAAVLRNPVINLPSMTTATDIPDWVHVEAGRRKIQSIATATYGIDDGGASTGTSNSTVQRYNWKQYRPPTLDEIILFYEKSPIRYVHNVTTPSLIALGMKDLRVPPSQGLEWYYTLRSNNVPSKLLVYENDDHAIDTVASEADHWINIKRWFDRYL